jgi:TatD DNase family protein
MQCSPAAVRLPDCHAHLDAFPDRELDLIREAGAASVGPIVTVGMDLESSRRALDLTAAHPELRAAAGLHPWHFDRDYDGVSSLEPFRRVVEAGAVVALSELGLDTIVVEAPVAVQQEALRWFMELAREREIPLVLHHRAAAADLVEVHRALRPPRPKVAIHGFLGDEHDARAFLSEGFWLSFGPNEIGMVGSRAVAASVLRLVPPDRLLVESDAYPAAEDRPEVPPAATREVLERIARARGEEPAALAGRVAGNFRRLFR